MPENERSVQAHRLEKAIKKRCISCSQKQQLQKQQLQTTAKAPRETPSIRQRGDDVLHLKDRKPSLKVRTT